jgi:hypothetical protein
LGWKACRRRLKAFATTNLENAWENKKPANRSGERDDVRLKVDQRQARLGAGQQQPIDMERSSTGPYGN